MGKFRNLDTDSDWTFGKGKNNYVSDNEAVKLDIKTRLQEWINDCFFELEKGIDYANRLGSKNQEELLQQDIKTIIIQTDGVAIINSFSFDVIDRKFSASYNVTTIYSESFDDFIEQAV